MWNHTRVTIFPETAKPDPKVISWQDEFFSHHALEDFWGALCWTESDQANDIPSRLIVNTKLQQRVYQNPRLVSIGGRVIVFSVLSDDGPSGTMRNIKKLYIAMREYHPA